MRLSVCMIMKNEKNHIAEWIDNVSDVVDECIIVDTGSHDESIAIAESKGIKVYHYKWDDDFSAAKNYALERATGDWIIFLDADERIEIKSKRILRDILSKITSEENRELLLIGCVNYDVANHHVISTTKLLRIFRNRPYLRFCGRIHENIQNLENGKMELLNISEYVSIDHYGYSVENVKGKLERNLTLLLREVEENGNDGRYDSYLCDCYYGLKNYEKVIEHAKRFIHSQYWVVGEEERIWGLLISSLIEVGTYWDDVEQIIKQAITEVPNAFLIKGFYGRCLTERRRYDEAVIYLLEATEHLEYEKEEIIKSLLCLGECLLANHKLEKAQLKYRCALELGCDKDTVFTALNKSISLFAKDFSDELWKGIVSNQANLDNENIKFLDSYIRLKGLI